MTGKEKKGSTHPRPPIVAVLGHVDHGKTTLLDFIRKTSVATKEHGGITQHIGAYQTIIPPKNKKDSVKTITFIDTPGHEAFAKMRSRGANTADIAILVVAADDGVMPQTKESIRQIQAAKIPMIVAMNKMDLPTANPEKVKQELAKADVQVEGFGGDVPIVSVSAKTGSGVSDLIDLIVLVAEMNAISSDPLGSFEAVVVETRVDKGKGLVATLIVKNGTLSYGDPLFAGTINVGKVRAMFDENGIRVSEAGPSKPVEVLGFSTLPEIGMTLGKAANQQNIVVSQQNTPKPVQMPDFLKPLSEQADKEHLNLVLKADTAGSLEAIIASLNPKIIVVSHGVGGISDADILLAKASKSFVIGFNVKIPADVEKLAQTEKVVTRSYTIIYDLLNELSEVVAGIKEVLTAERELGSGVIIAEFPFNDTRIAGTKVISGRLARGDSIKIMRNGEELIRTKIKSVRRGKDEVNKTETGSDCGVLFDKKVDFQINDVIIAVTL